jgi:hypothetical protein
LVVEQNNIRARFDCLSKLRPVSNLDFDFVQMSDFCFGGGDGFGNSARERDVIVLDQNAVVQTVTVISAATDGDGVFFEHS